jgi:hypothetical protein
MTDDSVSRYFEFYRVNLNGEKKKLQCCLHATVLLAVKYSAELNKYILGYLPSIQNSQGQIHLRWGKSGKN